MQVTASNSIADLRATEPPHARFDICPDLPPGAVAGSADPFAPHRPEVLNGRCAAAEVAGPAYVAD